MDADLDTLATALYARIDDVLKEYPELAPWRPKVGIAPKLSDAELLTLAVLQVLQGYAEETRWLRHASTWLRSMFPYLPGQSGYNKRLRKSTVQMQALIRLLAAETNAVFDDVWLVDSTPVECGRSRETVKRSDLAGVGRLRILRQPLALVLGAAAASRRDPGGSADHVRIDEPEDRRTRRRVGPVGVRSRPARRPTPSDAAGRQGLPVRRVRTTPRRSRCRADPTGHEGREASPRSAAVAVTAPDHRVDQPDVEGQAQSRASRRPHPARRRDPHHPTTPRVDRRDLAQPPHRPTRPTVTRRLRPLTPWNWSSRRPPTANGSGRDPPVTRSHGHPEVITNRPGPTRQVASANASYCDPPGTLACGGDHEPKPSG